jgi:3-hydroxymyristoyl/3-hydroxydecanoyl-(acyl carrier protein) dehydratase
MSDSVPQEENTIPAERYPIGPPFLFYDRILKCTETSCTVLKNVTRNEWCVTSASPQGYTYPLSIFLECLAQAAGVLDEHRQQDPLLSLGLVRINQVEVKTLPSPGDQVHITAEFVKAWESMVVYSVVAKVSQQQIACAHIYFVRH